MKYLLDTSTLSLPIAPVPDLNVRRRIDAHGPQCVIAAPVWHELLRGCMRMPASARRTEIEGYLYGFVKVHLPILPYDDRAAEWHAAERVRLAGIGISSPFIDGQIASVAAANDLILVTANTKDFVSFEGLDLEDWTKRSRR